VSDWFPLQAMAKAKPSIDIVNDYYPFVDFKFVFPEISPKVHTTPNILLMVLVNSGAKGDRFRKLREAIRQTWGNHGNCEQRKALGDESLKDLRWLLVFVVGEAGRGTRWSHLAKFLPLVRARIVSGHLTESGQFFEKCKFQFFNASPLKMRACGTGRKFAEYDQRGTNHDELNRAEAKQ
jgi:hypothetical protein